MGKIASIPTLGMEGRKLTKSAAQVILASLFLGLCAQIKIPMPNTSVPLTGQTLGIMAIGALLGSRKGALSVLLYLVQGSLGAPVFAGGGAGLMHIVGPTGGYLLSLPLEAFFIGWFLEKRKGKDLPRTLLAILLPCTLQLLAGSLWLSLFVGAKKMLAMGFYPFIPVEIAKASFVSLCLTRRMS